MGSTTPNIAAELHKLKNPELFVMSGLVNGQETQAADGKTFPVIEPASATLLAHCADLSEPDIVAAIDAADEGYVKFYESTTAKERGILLKKLYQLIMDNAEDCTLKPLPFVPKCPKLITTACSGHNPFPRERQDHQRSPRRNYLCRVLRILVR